MPKETLVFLWRRSKYNWTGCDTK